MQLSIQKNKQYKLFFTSDTHFGHGNILKHCNRPFADVHEMNTALIANWNAAVPADGIVIHAGDFAWRSNEISTYREKLNGDIVVVYGNHDKHLRKEKHRSLFCATCDMLILKLDSDFYITVCHYMMDRWYQRRHGSWHFFGHSHNANLPPVGGRYDIGVDNNNYMPISLEEAVAIMGNTQVCAVCGSVDVHASDWRQDHATGDFFCSQECMDQHKETQ